jgi:hypothetical protein
MKVARILFTALAAIAIVGSATASQACDKDKTTAAAVSADGKAACSAAMAAKCTPEMAAACKAAMAASAKNADHCAAMGASAKNADHCAAMKASAVSASAGECTRSTSAAAASANACSKSAATAVTASTGAKDDCCMKGGSAASAKAARTAKGMRISASNVEDHCAGNGMAGIASSNVHEDCEACLDMAMCSDALDAAGAHRQMVRLKNGVMLVYTADTPGKVRAIQAAVNSRGERLAQFAATGEHARLCDECKAIRAAMKSGKLNREVVNIEGGSLTLLTSSDAPTVSRIHAMTDQKVAARIKS